MVSSQKRGNLMNISRMKTVWYGAAEEGSTLEDDVNGGIEVSTLEERLTFGALQSKEGICNIHRYGKEFLGWGEA